MSKVRVSRSLHLVGATGASRKETFKGRDYIVVPVIALVEGVIHPVNAETPEYVTVESYSIAYEGWNGRPCFPDHPMRDGEQVLGNTPEILESEQFGIVFNAGLTDDKLTMEAWLNEEDAEAVGDSAVEIYGRARDGQPVEISVGVIVLMEEVKGTYNGAKYNGKWIEVFPDHLALLPEGDVGACSITMGCGVRTATAHRMAAKGYELVTAKEEPVVPAEKKKERKTLKSSVKERFGALLRMLTPAGRSDTDVRSELLEALEEVEPRLANYGWVVDVYDNEGLVVYCMYDEDYDMDLYVRDYKWDGKTAIIGTLYAEVEAHTVYEIEDDENQANEQLITQLRAAQKIAPKTAAAPCGCGGKKTTIAASTTATKETGQMTKDEKIAAMIAASGGKFTDADKPWLSVMPEAHLETLAAKPTPTPAPAEPAPNTGGTKDIPTTPKTPDPDKVVPETQDAFLARNPDLKKIVDRAAAQEKGRRSFLVGKLKDSQKEYTEAELIAMPIEDLERTARLLGSVNNEVVDYSGIATPRESSAPEEGAPAPPSLNEAVRAAAKARTQ